MKYDKATLKKFIINYHSVQKSNDITESNDDIDDFFELNNQVVTDFRENNNIEDVILYNELEEIVEVVGTDKEHYIFWLLSEGYSYKEIGNVFSVSAGRIGQILDALLKKLS
ncbi:sigma-70 family RNA polymerase sigma factor [Staphylococcus sp. GDH8C109P]|uniref:sigma-70 family RNA polymerase sigma factor n=1 Tax=Staphylococcus sp. GDH8C109P TaxID=2804088 RepID=UPI001AEC1341|nr:sigma-70 family RNA polymerase sigma factor [Staphylococcus sp. GDH8C109P]